MERKRQEMDKKMREDRARAEAERARPLEWRRAESAKARMVGQGWLQVLRFPAVTVVMGAPMHMGKRSCALYGLPARLRARLSAHWFVPAQLRHRRPGSTQMTGMRGHLQSPGAHGLTLMSTQPWRRMQGQAGQ